ncbi:bifunctional UDP-N-acetylglucosamine diphosphorylase/glucosamine-1-phosphate N-acetyltransferase GlmU [Sphingomonas sp.]|uniref:bifunctional UDP-N-acetylglucosamine diphosphorylase/glucosamine-1-phosphate N-acetyltransferase GlmU n=1 Tax=Sphingomonas sp. TaxID=28214 RepID=UPI0025CDAB86|nr:bifunctional UDP-N-acetylglucosamine diphosphorylase/glucosamine-1-phosphate N-acetyltransferase GlmU [Sphingomonas sp.]MBV9529171.1 bifunctional UDP-N-acetylglucosamine diphosphorylase/glucosamine-1-phosphate N-acetyltransferase GlmU [Sphingomonas sp.]
MTDRPRFAAVILAAGQGTRMRSDTHKVLHPVACRPLLLHLLDSVAALGAERQVVVVGKGREQVEGALAGRDVTFVHQAEQKGTGHAVQQAEAALEGYDGAVLVLYGDTPFVAPGTLRLMLDRLDAPDAPGVVVLASSPADPQSYGRIIRGDGDQIAKMVEYKDASDEERAVRLCNSGMMAVRAADLFRWLGEVGNENAAAEYYLPDIVTVAAREGRQAVVIEGDEFETAGINSRAELAQLERDWQRRRRRQALAEGTTLIDPDTVWFAFDTRLGRDVTIEPHVVFGPGVSIADGATIHAFSHIEGATIGGGASVGPFARLRPGARLGAGTRVGNFVEIKKADLGEGAKVNHLSYIGDAEVGARANIGAGTITCNYDGFGKYRTLIGEGAFIGSNTALVAPVTIGDDAIVGAGSVITRDVERDSLAIERSEQKGISGWAKRFRERMKRKATE